jgi:sterol desaturase/sphingolipid hydroxylase (fatty acid hydroxylase superfamily)
MEIAWHILTAGVAFLLLFAMFRPLEWAYPAQPTQKFFRPQWFVDLCFLLGEYLVFNGVVFWMLAKVAPWIHVVFPASVRRAISSQNQWLQLLGVIIVGDVLIYWGHRLQHRFDFLWRFHCIHHSAEHLDWLAAHREHPVDSLFTILIVNVPVFALGFEMKALAYFAAFRGLWAIFIHANVRLPLPKLLRVLIGAPELHHWHHDRSRDSWIYCSAHTNVRVSNQSHWGLMNPSRARTWVNSLTPSVDADAAEALPVDGSTFLNFRCSVRRCAQGPALIQLLAAYESDLRGFAIVTAEPWRVRVRSPDEA